MNDVQSLDAQPDGYSGGGLALSEKPPPSGFPIVREDDVIPFNDVVDENALNNLSNRGRMPRVWRMPNEALHSSPRIGL